MPAIVSIERSTACRSILQCRGESKWGDVWWRELWNDRRPRVLTWVRPAPSYSRQWMVYPFWREGRLVARRVVVDWYGRSRCSWKAAAGRPASLDTGRDSSWLSVSDGARGGLYHELTTPYVQDQGPCTTLPAGDESRLQLPRRRSRRISNADRSWSCRW